VSSLLYQYFFYFGSAMLIALIGVPVVRQYALSKGITDKGGGRRAHEGMVPSLGGVGIYTACMLPLLFSLVSASRWEEIQFQTLGIALGSTVVFVLGVVDDVKELPPWRKIAIEASAAALVWFMGVRVTLLSNPFGETMQLGLLSLPVTILWILVITNAMNLIDGLDGLAAGTGILIGTTLFVLSGPKDIQMKLTLLVLIGALLGFLRHNFPPATIFMGDSGSLFVGFFLGAFTILSSNKATAAVTILVPIIAFWHPLLDMTYTVVRRIYRGMPLGTADREHIHHKLIDRGLPKRKVLILLYLVNLTILGILLLLVQRQYDFELVALGILVLFTVVGLKMLGYIQFVPFAKENVDRFRASQRRRYLTYVIRRFSREIREDSSPTEIRKQIDDLLGDFGINHAEIRVQVEEADRMVYEYSDGNGGDTSMTIKVPVYEGDTLFGSISLSRAKGAGYLLCVSELAEAFQKHAAVAIRKLAEKE